MLWWLPRDEVYVELHPAAPHTVLVEAEIPEGTFPAAWAADAHPHVAVWAPGHREDMWRPPGSSRGLPSISICATDDCSIHAGPDTPLEAFFGVEKSV